jgi:hypothetical protein
VNAESEVLREDGGRGTPETVAGYLSAIAIFTSLVGIAWHPLRLILPAAAIALVASAMAGPGRRLQLAAVVICSLSLFLGLTIAVALSHALW